MARTNAVAEAVRERGAGKLSGIVTTEASPKTRTKQTKTPAADATPATEPASKKARFTLHIPEELIEEARNTVVALSGPPHRLTLSAFGEEAIRREIARLTKKENGGEPFPKRDGELKGGRPIKASA